MCPKYVLLEVSRKPFLEHFLQMFSELSTQKNGKHVYQVIQPTFWSLSLGGHQQPFQMVTFSPSPKKGDIMNHLVLRLFFCSFSPMGIPTICFQQQRSNGPIYPARHPWLKPPMWRSDSDSDTIHSSLIHLCPVCPRSPGTQMGPLVLMEKGLVFGGVWPSKIGVIWVPGILSIYVLWCICSKM